MSTMTITKAFAKGMYLGATGDTRVLKRQTQRILSRDLVAESWTSTGKAIRSAMKAMDQQTKRR